MADIKILHIFQDEKFFESTSLFFDRLGGVSNIYPYYSTSRDYKFNYIKSVDKLTIVYDLNEYKAILRDSSFDFVYIHGLSPLFYDYVLEIPEGVKVIWWSWGYDIYYSWKTCRPLLEVDMYKPLTKRLKGKTKINLRELVKSLVYTVLRPVTQIKLKKVISRIDYFTPVISVEYDLLKNKNPFFRARPFMLTMGPGNGKVAPFSFREKAGNIIIGNSLSYTNNHLDIFKAISHCKRSPDQKYIVPVSYGNEFDLSILKENFKEDNVQWLESFVTLDEYKKMYGTVSHAIFGMIRQQAMGNIYECLNNGIKVYLYKDSVIYRFLIDAGFTVFCLDDISEEDFLTPLDEESARRNHQLLAERISNRYETAKKELLNIYTDKL